MRNSENVLNILSEHSNVSGYKFERLYRILFNEQMFYAAYQRIYAKPGNMTPGTDGKTVDQMSIQRIENLIVSLRDETYKPHLAKRVYIPKKNGKKRPLGIPSFEDKLVQEVVRMILEAIYEGYFEYSSHGFRPNRSCHTALTHTQKSFSGIKWLIEGDIKGFFDNINHEILINTLKERIADERFIRLIRKFLNAGYIEDWKFHKTYSGTPQGGLISPILANIYLDKFDKYMKEYAQSFDKGRERKSSTDYKRLENKRSKLVIKARSEENESIRATLIDEIRKVEREIVNTPYGLNMDETFKRLKYVRYADDFLVGVIGSKAECAQIKANIALFMSGQLNLELSDEKTLITHAQTPAKFLGYEVYVRKSQALRHNRDGVLRRPFNGRIVLNVSNETVKKKLLDYNAISVGQANGKEVWKPKTRSYMIGMKPEDILAQYNAEIRGFYNYYSIANNISYLGNSFGFNMEYSMFKTIAQKQNSTLAQTIKKLRRGKNFIISYVNNKGQKRVRVLYNEGFKRKAAQSYARCDHIPNTNISPYPSLIERLKAEKCELCGAEGKTTMYHVRSLKDLKGANEWEQVMLKRYRKTLAVCETCNAKIHVR
jgi:group II intron reverse transcriptase/maturase